MPRVDLSRFEIADIRRYYDRHTPSFIRFGQGGRAGAIHRAVWGPGINTRLEAFHSVDDQIAGLTRSLLAASATPCLVDLGCGVAGSLCYLAERLPIRGTGITLSPVQVRLAAQRIRDARLSDRVTGPLDYLWGGSALQECLARGWIGYDLSVFRRIGS
jgi:SAM-dependent methyltransferase